MFTYTKKTQSGRSMIEMLGVLAIVGVLSAGGIAGYSMAMQSYKTTSLIDKVNLISQRVRTTYKGSYGNNTAIVSTDNNTCTGTLIDAGKISANDAVNPFGGCITVSGISANFTVTASSVPAESCVDLMTAEWGSSGVFTSVQAGTNAARTSAPVATADAITDCKAGGNVVFTFK